MNDALIHPMIRESFRRFLASEAHALLISGPKGSGKGFLLRRLVEDILGVSSDKAFASQSGILISPRKGTIGIDDIREIRRFLRLKTTGNGRDRRVVVIEDAETMTVEAQNALLKILEEPPLDTILLLSVNGEESLSPTIYSRVQRIRLTNPGRDDTLKYFGDVHEEQRIIRAYHLADGRVGLMSDLLDNQDNALADQLTLAKQIITSNTYNRLLLVDTLSKEKESFPVLFFALKQVCRAALTNSIEKNEETGTMRWHQRVRAIHDAEAALIRNPNNKLLINSLMLNL